MSKEGAFYRLQIGLGRCQPVLHDASFVALQVLLACGFINVPAQLTLL